VFTHRVLHELALALARGRNRLVKPAGLIGRQADVERRRWLWHISDDIKRDILPVMNLLSPTWDAEIAAAGATLRAVRLAQHAGAERLAANLYELDSGAMVSPLHFHHANEELLFVISGTPTLRLGADDERTLSPGEVVAFPVGPAGTHQVLNRSAEPARVLICATNNVPEVAEQVENDILAVITPEGLRLLPTSDPVTAS